MKYMFFFASALDQLLTFDFSSVTDSTGSTCITDGSGVNIRTQASYFYGGDSADPC